MVDVNLIDASFIAEGPVGKRGVVRPRRQAQLHRLLVQQRRPAGRRRRHRRARLLRLPGGLHLPARERRQGPDDVPRLGRRVPPEPEAARRRRPDDPRQLRRQHRRSAACRRPGSAAWARTSSRTSPPASARSPRTSAAATRSAFSFYGLRRSSCAPSGAPSSARSVKLIGGFDGYGLQVDVIYVGPPSRSRPKATPRYFSGPLTGLPTRDVQGLVHELSVPPATSRR